jgi:hypothetical protein
LPTVDAPGDTVITVPDVLEITSGEAAVPDGDKALVLALAVEVAAAVAVAVAVATAVGVDELPLPEHADAMIAVSRRSAGKMVRVERGTFTLSPCGE